MKQNLGSSKIYLQSNWEAAVILKCTIPLEGNMKWMCSEIFVSQILVMRFWISEEFIETARLGLKMP